MVSPSSPIAQVQDVKSEVADSCNCCHDMPSECCIKTNCFSECIMGCFRKISPTPEPRKITRASPLIANKQTSKISKVYSESSI